MLAVAGVAAMLALTGCGRADDGGQVATASGTQDGQQDETADQPVLDEDERRRQFTQCMRDNGVDLPDPEPGAGGKIVVGDRDGLDKDKVRAALEACRQFMPNGGERPPPSPEDLEKMRQFAQCMRDNGVDMPDPDPNTGGILIPKDGEDRPDEETLDKASEACRHLRPKIGVTK
jgi:hypothetical protein